MWSSTYYFEVTVHQIFADLCPFESFCKLFKAYCLEVIVCQRLIWAYNIAMLLWCVLHQKALLPRSIKLLPIFTGGRSTSPLISGPTWTHRLQFTKYQQRLCPNEIFLIFSSPVRSTRRAIVVTPVVRVCVRVPVTLRVSFSNAYISTVTPHRGIKFGT